MKPKNEHFSWAYLHARQKHKTFYDVSDPFSRSQLSHLVQTSGNVSVRTGDYSVKVTLKHKALTWYLQF